MTSSGKTNGNLRWAHVESGSKVGTQVLISPGSDPAADISRWSSDVAEYNPSSNTRHLSQPTGALARDRLAEP
jgi:hypothetical protein